MKDAISLLNWITVEDHGQLHMPIWYNGIEEDLKEALKEAVEALECGCCEYRVGDECCYAVVNETEPLKWERLKGVMTPGGDPCVRCPVCKARESEHLIGIESGRHWKYCPMCGERLDE